MPRSAGGQEISGKVQLPRKVNNTIKHVTSDY